MKKMLPQILGILLVNICGSLAKPGIYATNPKIVHVELPNPLNLDYENVTVTSRQACEDLCVLDDICDAYSHSNFHSICRLHKMVVGVHTGAINKLYYLYVLEKSEDDGYHRFKDEYFRLYDTLKNSEDAQAFCLSKGGKLPEIGDQEMQDFLTAEVGLMAVFQSFLGITDQKSEGTWLQMSDGRPLPFQNWDWRGVWFRPDLNCAYMRVDGTWKHIHCDDKLYFFCQYPMLGSV